MRINLLTQLLIVGALLTGSLNSQATTYYVSSSGSDHNSGTSPSAPWQTLNPVNSLNTSYLPGDQVLFKCGDTFYGEISMFYIQGSVGNPVTFSSYGSGNRPVIDCQGYGYGIALYNCSRINIFNLQFTGNGGPTYNFNSVNYNMDSTPSTTRTAILIYSDSQPSSYIYIYNCIFTNLYGANGNSNKGIGIEIVDESGYPGIANNNTYTTVQNCTFSALGGSYGVKAEPTWDGNAGGNGAINNVYVMNCVASGVELLFAHDSQYLYFVGNNVSGAEGAWMENCKYFYGANNNVQGAHAATDGTGIHVDSGNQFVTIEYNYFANNSGGFVEVLGGNHNICFRYNISINDGARIIGQNGASQTGKSLYVSDWTSNGARAVSDVFVYNNTVYENSADIKTNYIVMSGVYSKLHFYNNIFQYTHKTSTTQTSTLDFDRNDFPPGYYGISGIINWNGFNVLPAYGTNWQPGSGSGLLHSGEPNLDGANNTNFWEPFPSGLTDYYGNAIHLDQPNIGGNAHY